jgi:predicted kinase
VKRLYVMQGVPGSGKSTIADYLGQQLSGFQLSTDMWRYAGGAYEYDPETNKRFHTDCQKACIIAMQDETPVIIIDNTNITYWQAEPYIIAARIFDYEVQVIRVDVNVEVAIARQLERPEERRVPEHVIRMMHDQIEDLV